MSDAFQKMDKMYRHQRYFYDLTRKYYLLGRDKLIEKLNVKDGENILEIGCGTARNLLILARKFPDTNFYGLDASAAMLETAHKKIEAKKISNITLKNVLAGDFNYKKDFDLTSPFDTIYFSYSITMIPDWREAIANALDNLKSGRSLHCRFLRSARSVRAVSDTFTKLAENVRCNLPARFNNAFGKFRKTRFRKIVGYFDL